MIRVRIISFKLLQSSAIMKAVFVFPYVCNVSNCTDQCFEPNAKRFVCSQNIPNGKQFICFQKVWYLSCKCLKNSHLFYEYVVEFNEQNEIRCVFKLKCLWARLHSEMCALFTHFHNLLVGGFVLFGMTFFLQWVKADLMWNFCNWLV